MKLGFVIGEKNTALHISQKTLFSFSFSRENTLQSVSQFSSSVSVKMSGNTLRCITL